MRTPRAAGAGLTTTVMPSASSVAGGGSTCTLDVSEMPSPLEQVPNVGRGRLDGLGLAVDDQGHVLAEREVDDARQEQQADHDGDRLNRSMGSQPANPRGADRQPSSNCLEEGFRGKRLSRTEAFKRVRAAP